MNINPNSERHWIKEFSDLSPQEQARRYPLFFRRIHFDVFRHLRNMDLEFTSPISVISGTNKSGKTTALIAITCSHHNFQRRRQSSGNLERNTWGDVMRFTDHDIQQEDWVYHVSYRRGTETITRQGKRNHNSRKWSGVAKKQGQLDSPRPGSNQAGRQVTFIDLERLQPARHLPPSVFQKAKAAPVTSVDVRVSEYMSYILEIGYRLDEICSSADNVIYKFYTNSTYSSYNSASGEDVLTRLLRDIVDTPNKSLVLIEEIEVGLHPKIQRRLIDVLMYESHVSQKQFIVTTHSQTILSSVNEESRLFLDAHRQKCIKRISTNAALSKMDAIAFPLVNLLVEDDLAKWILLRIITGINSKMPGFAHLINIVVCGNADKTYSSYCFLRDHYIELRPKCGYACVLDGDKKIEYSGKVVNGDLISFLPGNDAPEKVLLSAFLQSSPDDVLQYHLNSNPHCLFHKMQEQGICPDEETAKNLCWNAFEAQPEGQQAIQVLSTFMIETCKKFSPDL